MWNLKKNNDTNKLVYKVETDSQILEKQFMVTSGIREREGIVWDFETDMCMRGGSILNCFTCV